VREVGLGEAPDGFTVTVDNLATQALGDRLEVAAWLGDDQVVAVFEVAELEDGKILTDNDQLSEEEFQDEFGCTPPAGY
jgi:hypothetical protein